jgi:hypothetical protein
VIFNHQEMRMPYGIGLHVIIALFFAIHAIRTHRELFWLFILFAFPLLGSIAYFFAVYLPESRLQEGVRKTLSTTVKALDPGRNLREAKQAYELAPTVQNRIQLADALIDNGEIAAAGELYEGCLQGPFAQDPEIRFGVARARLLNHQAEAAAQLLLQLRQDEPQFRVEQIALLLAQAFAQTGNQTQAKQEFEFALNRSGNLDVQVEYAIWAINNGEREKAQALYQDIEKARKNWNKHTRSINAALIERLETAFANRS